MKSNRVIFSIFLLNIFVSSVYAEVLNFSRAYERALENSNSIKSSVYLSKSDKEKIIQEESQLYPQVNLSASYRKSEYTTNPTKHVTKQGLKTYSITARQSIYNPEVYSRIDMQESRSEYSHTKVELEKEELAQNLFNVYLDVLKSKNRIEVLKAYSEYSRSKLQELTKKYEVNLSNKMDLLEMRVEYNSSQIDLNKEIKLLKVYELKLKQLIGDLEYELPVIDINKPILEMINSMKERVLSDDNTSLSLKIKQAQIALKISQEDIKSASSGHLPKVNLDATYSKYSTDSPTIDSPYDNVKSVMLTLNIPIYSGGYVSSREESSRLMSRASSEDLQNTTKEVKVEYDRYLALFDASVESVSMYKEAFESAELYVEAVDQGYEHGLKSIIDLNDAKNKLYEVKYKYIENIYEMVDSYIGLLIVTNNFKDIDILDKLVE